MSIIEELYHGNISPSQKYIKEGSELQKTNNKLIEHIEQLLPLLNEEEKRLYEKIEEAMFRLNEISEKERFFEGFCIGAQMVWEIVHFKSTNYV